VITIESLTKRFDDRTVLDAVSVTFQRGRVSSIFGPSGSGKSTLLRCINGLERFDAGSISIGDLKLGPKQKGVSDDRSLLRKIRLKAGMVFQHFGLFAHMTALENVMEAPVHVKGIDKTKARDAAAALLEKVGLSHRKNAFPRELSGGEQQRVAIARALAMEPEALLLDEPTSALDPERKVEVANVLAALAKEGATMIVVTHEPAIVRSICDRAVVLVNGKIDREGTPAEVLDK
jgi:polar amino acid transport system ATP-binding protein